MTTLKNLFNATCFKLQKGMQNIKSCMPRELYLPGPPIQLQKSTALFFRKTNQLVLAAVDPIALVSPYRLAGGGVQNQEAIVAIPLVIKVKHLCERVGEFIERSLANTCAAQEGVLN